MNWLTQTEIKEAAKTVATAMDCSVKHWRQLATATFRELVWAAKRFGTDLTNTYYCALCVKHGLCRENCPIGKYSGDSVCGNTPYSKAADAWECFLANHSLLNYRKFHKAANREYRFLLKVRKWWKEQK